MDLTGLMAKPLIVTFIPNSIQNFNFIERTFIDPIHWTDFATLVKIDFRRRDLWIGPRYQNGPGPGCLLIKRGPFDPLIRVPNL